MLLGQGDFPVRDPFGVPLAITELVKRRIPAAPPLLHKSLNHRGHSSGVERQLPRLHAVGSIGVARPEPCHLGSRSMQRTGAMRPRANKLGRSKTGSALKPEHLTEISAIQ